MSSIDRRVAAVEDLGHAADREEPQGQGRARGRLGIGEIRRALLHHRAPRQEFEGRRVRRGFGLDEHGAYVDLGTDAIKGGKTLRNPR